MEMYGALKTLHIVAIISWMAGLLYLPRLYVYHAGKTTGSELYETLLTMEGRLLRYIMAPAAVVSWLSGIGVAWASGVLAVWPWWFVCKVVLVVGLSVFHGICRKCHEGFQAGTNTFSHNWFRMMNEVPTVIMIIIVGLVVFRP